MATTLDARPTATTYDVETLVKAAWEGKVRVPHFQRDFRWGADDVRRLFDSIVKGYPIGSLLLWTRRAPAETLRLGGLTIEAPEMSEALWVVDGQQRLTSIANALHPGGASGAFALSYDLRSGDFIRTPTAMSPLVIPLPVIFDLKQILGWFAAYPEISTYLDQATGITQSIRQFEVPAYLVKHDDPGVLQDIFDRMNNYGKRLSRAEIFTALNAGDELDTDGSLTFERIAEELESDLHFGKIDNDTVLACVLARRGSDVRRDIRSEFTKDDDEGRDAAYEAGALALRRAVAFLQRESGVPHFSMLAYKYLLVVLTRVFAFHPEPDSRNVQLLRRWYWQASVGGPERFRGGTPNAARVLCTQVTETDLSGSVQSLLKAVAPNKPSVPDLSRFATREAATKMTLCVMWSAKPRDLISGEQYELPDLALALADQSTARDAVRYVLPRGSLPEKLRPWAANRILAPTSEVDASDVSAILSRPTLDLSADRRAQMLASHLISPAMATYLANDESIPFLEARQELLRQHLHNFLDRMCEWQFENTPPLRSLVMDEDADADE